MPDDIQDMNYLAGISAFQNARMRGFWTDVLSLVRGKPAELLSFEDVRARLRLREESYLGLHDVPLAQIVGSVGRYRDFTRGFLPKSAKMQDRWSRVYAQATGLTGLPPIELYKVGEMYFVRDGNHRVSVARQLGSETIQAHVTLLPTTITLDPKMSPEELDELAAYAEFLDNTRLPYMRPRHQSLQLSEPSRYTDLLGHIHVHKAVLEQQQGREISLEDAAADWYDIVYRPALTLIRKYDVMKYWQGRTEGDLYLWMIDHLREVQAALDAPDDDGAARRFSDALVDFLANKRIPVPKDLLTEKDDTVKLAREDVEASIAEIRARQMAQQAAMVEE
ncbi:MAG: hypothetical protein L6Q98_13210 [Anaerolineae bacterium]|nr:hypothetical protein [Anaerolineae bacterium]NUQ03250.1 hypothetical protein [Anaerolineae bacterium]